MRLLALTLAAAVVTLGSVRPARAADPETSFLRVDGYHGVPEQTLTPSDGDLFGTVGTFNNQPDLFISFFNPGREPSIRWQITLVPAGGTPLAPGTYVAGEFGEWPARPVMQVLHFGELGGFNCMGGTFTIHSIDGPQVFDVSWTQECEGRGVSGRATFRPPPDLEPPRIFVPDPIVLAAQVPEGAIVDYEVRVVDDIDPHPALSCTPIDLSLFPIGLTTVTCTAVDAAGRSSTASFTVRVLGVADIIPLLREFVQSTVPDPMKHVLSLTLTRAAEDLAAGRTDNTCISLRTFELQVQAQEGGIPTGPDLIFAARHLRLLLRC